MKKEKSKLLKLKKKSNNLKRFGKNCIFISALSLAVLSGVGLISSLIFNLPMWICLTFSALFVGTFAYSACYDYLVKLIEKKFIKIDNEINELAAKDCDEKSILNEFNSIKKLENEIKSKKILIREMIKRKRVEAVDQKSLIKKLTKTKKANARKEAIEEVVKDKESKNIEESNTLDKD